MSDTFQKIGDLDAAADKAAQLADHVLDWLQSEGIVDHATADCVLGGTGYPPGPHCGKALNDPSLGEWLRNTRWTNGLSVETGRLVYFGGQTCPTDPACPHCGAHLNGIDHGDALGKWMKSGISQRTCPSCQRNSHINDWTMDPQWGIGHLQLCFWNWPPLHPNFRAELATHLGGHRLVYLYDKF